MRTPLGVSRAQTPPPPHFPHQATFPPTLPTRSLDLHSFQVSASPSPPATRRRRACAGLVPRVARRSVLFSGSSVVWGSRRTDAGKSASRLTGAPAATCCVGLGGSVSCELPGHARGAGARSPEALKTIPGDRGTVLVSATCHCRPCHLSFSSLPDTGSPPSVVGGDALARLDTQLASVLLAFAIRTLPSCCCSGTGQAG